MVRALETQTSEEKMKPEPANFSFLNFFKTSTACLEIKPFSNIKSNISLQVGFVNLNSNYVFLIKYFLNFSIFLKNLHFFFVYNLYIISKKNTFTGD